MRTIFFFIACSCLINGLTASFPGFALRDEETTFDSASPQLDIFFPDIKNADSLIVPYPTDAVPTSPTPSTTPELTSTPSTRPTRPPRPTRPTRPTPTTETTTTTSTTTSRPTRPTRPTPTTETTTTTSTTTSRPTRPPRPTRPTRPTPTTETTTTTSTTTSRPTRPPRPTRPTRPTPTTETTTTTSTTTSRPTRPPRPTRPTRPTTNLPLQPFPTSRPRPELDRVQVYKNAFRSLGPLAGRLVNVVANREGNQKTAQQNEIVYNLRSFKVNGDFLEQEDSEV